MDGTARIWNCGPTGDAPAWFIEFAEQLGGWKLGDGDNPARVPWRAMNPDASDGAWARFARWLLTRGDERTINAASSRTTREFVANQVERGTRAALFDANDALPGNPLVLAGLASEIGNRIPAAFLCKHAAQLAPHDAAVHYRIALAHRKFGELAEASAAIKEAIRLDPGNTVYSNIRDEMDAPK